MEKTVQLRRSRQWLSIGGWILLYVCWVIVFQKREFAFSRTATVQFCYLIFIALNFYFNVYYNIPRFLVPKRYVVFGLLLITGIIITALLRVPLATWLNRNYFIPGKPQPGFTQLFTSSLLNISIWVLVILTGKLIIDRYRFQQHIQEIARQKERAELDFLNAQFNPHFLFNSLNSIYGHIDKQNVSARNMLLTFSEMLRYQLYECNSNDILIEKELNYIRNYVELQKARKDENVEICFSIDENVKAFSIAPLLFIAFIENSFKYVGAEGDGKKSIHISFKKQADKLFFRCGNTKEKIVAKNIEHKGIGMANAKRRLSLLYPEKHELVISDRPDFYEIKLNIQVV